MVDDIEDSRRTEPPFVLDERAMLEGWLEFHRITLLFKCEGLDDAQRKARPVPTSLLSLHGLVRHMAEVERGWFRRALLDDPGLPDIWPATAAVEDGDLAPLDDADWDADLQAWHDECEASRRAAAPLSLDHTGRRRGDCADGAGSSWPSWSSWWVWASPSSGRGPWPVVRRRMPMPPP